MNRTRVGILAAIVVVAIGCAYAMSRPPAVTADADAAAPSASTTSIASTVASIASSVAMIADDAQSEASASADDASTASTDAAVTTKTDAGKTDGATVTIDESSAGKTIDLAKGQKLVVALKAKPGSGFDWAVTKAPAALGTPEKTFEGPGGEGLDPIGKRKLTFTVGAGLGKDEQAVELGYARSFEPGKPAFRTFAFKVRAAR